MRLTVETETSGTAATKSCCRCFAVSQGFLTTCLLRTLVIAVDSFLFLPRSGSVANVPLTSNLRTMLPTVSLGTFSAFVYLFVSFCPCLCKDTISSLNFLDSCLYLKHNFEFELRVWDVLSQAHLMQLMKFLISCISTLLWGILFRGLNIFETAVIIESRI